MKKSVSLNKTFSEYKTLHEAFILSGTSELSDIGDLFDDDELITNIEDARELSPEESEGLLNSTFDNIIDAYRKEQNVHQDFIEKLKNVSDEEIIAMFTGAKKARVKKFDKFLMRVLACFDKGYTDTKFTDAMLKGIALNTGVAITSMNESVDGENNINAESVINLTPGALGINDESILEGGNSKIDISRADPAKTGIEKDKDETTIPKTWIWASKWVKKLKSIIYGKREIVSQEM